MRRIVLPCVTATTIATDVVHTVAATDVCVAIEVVVVVYVDVAAAPATAPTPAATPRSTHCHAHAKRDRTRSYYCAGGIRRVIDWRVWVYRCAVHNSWVV